jgi:hypothetical protein
MARFYTGAVTLPSDGSPVALCPAGEAGALVANPPGGADIWVGGPDVTPDTGLPVASGETLLIPGTRPPASWPVAEVEAAPPVLYACASRGLAGSREVRWLSTQPAP